MCALEMYRVTSRVTKIFFKSSILLLDSHGIVMKPSFVHYTCFIYRFKWKLKCVAFNIYARCSRGDILSSLLYPWQNVFVPGFLYNNVSILLPVNGAKLLICVIRSYWRAVSFRLLSLHEIHISKRALKGPKFVDSMNLAAMMMSKLFEVFQQMNMIFGSKSNPYGIVKLFAFRISVNLYV